MLPGLAVAATSASARRRSRRNRLAGALSRRTPSIEGDTTGGSTPDVRAAAAETSCADANDRGTRVCRVCARGHTTATGASSPPSRTAAAAAAALAAARAATLPELPNGWDSLPEGVLASVFASLPRPSLQAARLVCQRWRAVVDGSVAALTPSTPAIYKIASRFPALRTLNLGGSARNRAAVLLSRPDALRGLRALALGGGGGAGGRGAASSSRLTNAALTALASGSARTRLTALKLTGCDAFTNAGIGALTALSNLRTLALVGCERTTDAGLASVVGSLPALAALETTTGADATLAALRRRAGLTSLRLGGKGAARVTGDGLASLPAASLRSLCLSGAGVGAPSLARFTRLTSLALRGCPAIDNEDVRLLASSMKQLHALDLRHCRVGDAAVACLSASPSLRALRLEGTACSPAAALALAALPALTELGVDAYNPTAGGGGCLTAAGLAAGWAAGGRLTRLSIRGVAVPAPLIAALPAAFPALADLTIVDWGGALAFAPGTGRLLPPPAALPPRVVLAPLARLRQLSALDLASPRLADADALSLAAALPKGLESLVLAAPGVSAGCVAALKAARPGLAVGRARRKAPDEWTGGGGGGVWA